MKYERERHDAANQKAEYWVKIPSVSSTADTDFYMYYGNSDASDGADLTNVWDANFKGVWHLKDDPSGAAPQAQDSTVNNNDGTSQGSMTSGDLIAGKADGAWDFDGIDDWNSIPDNAVLTQPSGFTVEYWIDSTSDAGGGISKDDDNDGREFYTYHDSNGVNKIDFVVSDNDEKLPDPYPPGYVGYVGRRVQGPAGDIDGEGWVYLAFTYYGGKTPASTKIFKNGDTRIDDTDYIKGNFTKVRDTNAIFKMARIYDNEYPQNIYNNRAAFDEVRFSAGVRSLAWIEASYHSGNNDLLTFSGEETANRPPNIPVNPAQLKSDGIEIPEGGTTGESTVIFKGTVSDPDGDNVRLEIELRRIDEPFTGEPTPETISEFAASGTEVSVARYGLVTGSYKWRYRAKDSKGGVSEWREYGTSKNVDFNIFTKEGLEPYIKPEAPEGYYINKPIRLKVTVTNPTNRTGVNLSAYSVNLTLMSLPTLKGGVSYPGLTL